MLFAVHWWLATAIIIYVSAIQTTNELDRKVPVRTLLLLLSVTLFVVVAGCDGGPLEKPLISVSGDLGMAACNVWSDYARCQHSNAPNTSIEFGTLPAGADGYAAVTAIDLHATITVDLFRLPQGGVDISVALAHAMGHRIGLGHLPAGHHGLMSVDFSTTWRRVELTDSDREMANDTL